MLAAAVARAKGDQPWRSRRRRAARAHRRPASARPSRRRGAARFRWRRRRNRRGARAKAASAGANGSTSTAGSSAASLASATAASSPPCGDFGFGTEARRFGPERGRRIGEVADHRRRQQRRQADRHRAGQRVAPGQSQRHRAAPGQHDAQLPVRHGAQPRQIVVVDEFGGERQHRPLAPVEQDRLAAAQRDNCRVEHPPPG